MSNQANRFKDAPDRHHQKGVRKWRRELEKFGSGIIPQIPKELLADVMGTRAELAAFESQGGVNHEIMSRLGHSIQVRQGTSAENLLAQKYAGKSQNMGTEEASMLDKMLNVYQVIKIKLPR
ncbi:MAG: hypothetical protein WAV41_03195 [Microgenomates group bacterium]